MESESDKSVRIDCIGSETRIFLSDNCFVRNNINKIVKKIIRSKLIPNHLLTTQKEKDRKRITKKNQKGKKKQLKGKKYR